MCQIGEVSGGLNEASVNYLAYDFFLSFKIERTSGGSSRSSDGNALTPSPLHNLTLALEAPSRDPLSRDCIRLCTFEFCSRSTMKLLRAFAVILSGVPSRRRVAGVPVARVIVCRTVSVLVVVRAVGAGVSRLRG